MKKIILRTYSNKQNKDVILTFIGDEVERTSNFLMLKDRKLGLIEIPIKNIQLIETYTGDLDE